MEMPIPPLPEETSLYLVCWPTGYEWAAILRGLVTAPARGRFWDGKTGNIGEVQQYVKDNVNMAICDELILVLAQIRDNLAALDATQIDIKISNQASAEANQQTAISTFNLAQATANSSSWANSLSQSWAEAYVQLAIELEAPRLSPTESVPTPFITPTGITATAAVMTSSPLCNRVVYIVDMLIEFVDLWRLYYSNSSAFSLGIFQGIAAALFETIATGKASHPIIIPAAVLAALVGELGTVVVEYEESVLDDFYQWLVDNRQSFICTLWAGANNDDDTITIQRAIKDIITGNPGLVAPASNVVKLFYNRTTLGLLYYVAVDAITFPSASTTECTGCDE